MTDLPLFCPQCGSTFPIDEKFVGQKIQCPNCSADLIVKSEGEGGIVACLASGKQRPRPEIIPVTSCSIADPHELLGMVCITIGTRGQMAAQFQILKQAHNSRIAAVGKGLSPAGNVGQFIGGIGLNSQGDIDFAGQYSGATFHSNDPEVAFHIAVSQIQLRASYLGADAVIGFRYDIDLDSNSGVMSFVAFAYGTAVKRL